MKNILRMLGFLAACTVSIASLNVVVHAEKMTSPNFTLDGTTSGSFGGETNSTNYKMTSLGGEAIGGNTSSKSYKMLSGFSAGDSNPFIEVSSQPTGLDFYYPFEEPSGTAVLDGSKYSRQGSITDTATRITEGKIGSALELNGSTDSIKIPAASLPAPSSTFTVAGWYKILGTPNAYAYPDLFTRQASNTNRQFSAWVDKATGKVGASSSVNGVLAQAESSTAITDGEWHHIAYSVSEARASIYVDGVLDGYVDLGGAVDKPSADIDIGLNRLNASVDEFKMYSKSFSASEVKAEYLATNAGVRSGVTFGSIIPGTSRSTEIDVSVTSTVPAYTLAINQDQNLRKEGPVTIPSIGSTIASPAAWSEGNTFGLGFSLTTAPLLDSKWGTGSNYAQFPGSATTFFTREGSGSISKDSITLRARLDVAPNQASGNYQNTVIITGTTLP